MLLIYDFEAIVCRLQREIRELYLTGNFEPYSEEELIEHWTRHYLHRYHYLELDTEVLPDRVMKPLVRIGRHLSHRMVRYSVPLEFTARPVTVTIKNFDLYLHFK